MNSLVKRYVGRGPEEVPGTGASDLVELGASRSWYMDAFSGASLQTPYNWDFVELPHVGVISH